jgi:hypothetical protein
MPERGDQKPEPPAAEESAGADPAGGERAGGERAGGERVGAADGPQPAGAAGRRTWSARWQPLAAAGAVVLLAGGAVAVAAMLGGGTVPGGGPVSAGGPGRPGEAAAPQPRTSLAQLLVRDGDTVAASGDVHALPGRPVRLCAPRAVGAIGYAAGHEPLPVYCDAGVTLVGADLHRLAGRAVRAGIVTGRAWIQGTYRAGTITVTRQGAPRQTPTPVPTFPDRPPCAAPSGGWIHTDDLPGLDQLQSFLAAHPDRYGEIVITYPDGPPAGPTDSPGYVKTQVAMVSTTGDQAAAYRELRTVFTGNLCVTRAPRNRTAVDAAGRRLNPMIRSRSNQVSSWSPDYYTGRFHIELDIVDQAWYGQLTTADGGTGVIDAVPWLTPAR